MMKRHINKGSRLIVNKTRELLAPNMLFIWIPKNAGTSIYNLFHSKKGMILFKDVEMARKKFRNKGAVTFGHISVKGLIEEGIVSEEYYKRSKVFCVARNPYDRFVSLLHYLKKHDLIPQDYNSLDLISKIADGIPEVGPYNSKGLSQCNPQMDWVRGLEIDYVLRFEELDDTNEFLKASLGKYSLGHHNRSSKRDSRPTELDKVTIAMINDYYKEDFVHFGYKMK